MRQALQRVSALDDLGDPDAPVGSESWARWFVGQARDQRKKLDDDVSRMQRLLGKLESGQAWKALGFLSFSVLCHTELELSETEAAAIKSAKRGRSLAAVLAADPGTRPLEKHGGMREQGADGTLARGSNQASYLVRRLKRDAPEICEALGRGEYPSARAAAIAAGIIRVKTPLERALAAYRKLSPDDTLAFLQIILNSSEGSANV